MPNRRQSGPRQNPSSRSGRIRLKPNTARGPQALFESISRPKALSRVMAMLGEHPAHPEACRLIELFNLDAEELAEAGLTYEGLKVLESHCLTIRRFS